MSFGKVQCTIRRNSHHRVWLENSNTFSPPTMHMNIHWDIKGWKWSLSTGVAAVHSGALKAVHRVMPGGWEGGSLTALWEAVKQMHTIGRVVAIDTMLRIVGYLSVRKYSCFYLFIHTYVFCFPLHLSFDRTQRNTPSSQFVTMKTSLMGWFFLSVFNRNFLFVFFFLRHRVQ